MAANGRLETHHPVSMIYFTDEQIAEYTLSPYSCLNAITAMRGLLNFTIGIVAIGTSIGLCTCPAVATDGTAGRDTGKPNVLFIAVDDLNDWVGFLGGHPQAHTPNIDSLANEGAVFKYAYCPAPVCGPSRTALMYGISPHKSGSYGHQKVYDPKELIPTEQLPINLVFQNNGYYTAGCGKIFHYPEPRGWDEYERHIKGNGVPKVSPKIGNGIELRFGVLETDNDSDTSDGKLTDWAIEQLQRKHEKPFFIALGLRKPHLPWEAPKKYFEQYDLEKIKLPSVLQGDLDDVPNAGKIFASAMVGFSLTEDHKAIAGVDGAWQKLVRAYLATSSFADANVGRLLNALKAGPHLDNTIVLLWGDHGWHLGEKDHWRKMTLWERGTRTPLIIKMPGAAANSKKFETPVSLQDIFPTLVDLCDLEIEQKLDGESLKPLLENPSVVWDKHVLMSHGPGNFAIRKGQLRLIHYADGSEELYDIASDPSEFTNLAHDPKYADRGDKLRDHIPKSWRYIMGPRFEQFPDSFAKPTAPAQTE